MPYIIKKCKTCDKIAETKSEYIISGSRFLVLKCGHLLTEKILEEKTPESIISLDNKKLLPFQCEGVRFLERANANALLADEPGLGKTVQLFGLLSLHPELTPALAIVKAALKVQWQHENMRWLGENQIAQIIEDARSYIIPKLPLYIVSFDLLRRIKDFPEKIKKMGIKLIVIDECQQIKNPESERTKAVRELCRQVDHVIALSGTPIKNNAGEYFSILNILQPNHYPRYSHFIYNETQSYFNGYSWKVGGLKDPKGFQAKTKNFILRRTREEVLPELPTITRNFKFCNLSKAVEKEYQNTFKQFKDEYDGITGTPDFGETSNILAYLSKMRHLTGLAKIDPCIDHVMEFLGGTDRKITIFVHHKDVAQILQIKLASLCEELELEKPLMLTSDLDSDQRGEVVRKFREEPRQRVLIASTLASGEGLNLQFCSDCVILERQWNPANEEQAEGRFVRIGQLADKITALYFVAVGTVDEFFSKLVEQKREIFTSTMGGEAVEWNQTSLIKELAEILASTGGKQWGW